MFRKVMFTCVLAFVLVLAAACGGPVTPTSTPAGTPHLPNPASVYCQQHGGKLEMRTDATGGVSGRCVFPDKSQCDEWAYYRGECKPGAATAATAAANAWRVYRDERLG